MDENVPQVNDIQSYHNHFRKVAQSVRNQPLSDRTCNDRLCFLIFLIITVAFIGIGEYYLRSTDIKAIFKDFIMQNDNSQYYKNAQSAMQGYSIENVKPAIPIIICMMGFSILMAAVFLFLIVKFPKFVFIFMLVLGLAFFSSVTALLFYIEAFVPAIILCVIIGLLLFILICTWKKIKTGLALLSVASKFLIERPGVIFAPIAVLLFVIVFEVFWALSLAGMMIYKGDAKTPQEIESQKSTNYTVGFFWGLFNVFYAFFFYYCICFIIATAAGFWYYHVRENFLVKAIGRIMAFHLGSFTLASILVSFISIIRQYTDRQSRQGIGPVTTCALMCCCCIKISQDLLETLNHNAIITMSVTGQNYFDSAKSTLSLIFQNFPLYFLIDLISHLVIFVGVIFICGVPSATGLILLRNTAQNPDDTTSQAIGTIMIILFSMLVGGIFLSALSQALSSIFILFCLDNKFIQMGYPAPDLAPRAIKDMFTDLVPYIGGDYNEHYEQVRNKSSPRNQQSNIQRYPNLNQNTNPYY